MIYHPLVLSLLKGGSRFDKFTTNGVHGLRKTLSKSRGRLHNCLECAGVGVQRPPRSYYSLPLDLLRPGMIWIKNMSRKQKLASSAPT